MVNFHFQSLHDRRYENYETFELDDGITFNSSSIAEGHARVAEEAVEDDKVGWDDLTYSTLDFLHQMVQPQSL